jgi:putative endonuclease
MITERRIFGDLGEKLAKEFLEKNGYLIVDRNYSKRWGEIDIIAISQENELVFVEIKTREVTDTQSAFPPEDSVNFIKQQKIIKTAQTFLYESNYSEDVNWRIDVIAIEINKKSRKAKIRHIKHAIEL